MIKHHNLTLHVQGFFYVHGKLPKRRSYEKFVRKMLMKLTVVYDTLENGHFVFTVTLTIWLNYVDSSLPFCRYNGGLNDNFYLKFRFFL